MDSSTWVAVSLLLGCALPAQQFVAENPPGMQWMFVLEIKRGDTDGDGDSDLYQRIWDPALRWFSILHNDGNGSFTDVSSTASVQIGAESTAFIDFDGDGDDDLFVSLVSRGQLLRRVAGGWTDATALLPASPAWHENIVGDLDGDGDLDLAGVGGLLIAGRNQVLRNDGPAGFTALDPFPGLEYRIRAADFDGDLDLDLLLWNPAPRLLRNDGGMTFTEITATWLPASLPTVNTFEFGDVDGDDDQDLVLGSDAGNNVLLLNIGGSFLAIPGALPPSGGNTYVLRLADVDEDRDLDLWGFEAAAGTTLALNNGGGLFIAAPARLPAAPTPSTSIVADLDGDGDADAVTNAATSVAILWNRHRHVAIPAPPARGSTWTVELSSQPGYGATTRLGLLAVGLARMPQRLPLLPFGTLWLDLATPFVLASTVFIPAAGAATFPFAVPPVAAIAGVDLHVQGLVEDTPGQLRFTALQTSRIQ